MSTQTHSGSSSSYESTKSQSRSNQSKDKEARVVEILKKISEDPCSSSKKLLPFQKLWNNEDEIVVLEEAVRYKKSRGSEPTSNVNDFHSLLDQSLKQNYSKNQLRHKLRRFKRKYMRNVTNVKSKSLSKSPHEKNIFVLSEKIWGNKSAETEAEAAGNINPSNFISDYSDSIMSGFVQSWGSVKKYLYSVEKKQELEKRWIKLASDEMELLITKCELVNENARSILEALNSSHQ